ncbi:MAG: hypothetical protein CVU47_07175 [Chloroflexi bacterium HGW-Chloroflexi-9]|nr:MAG: hypothetical protein CVU47_07175 [Chloroflexi bacterium HGW-Chloroflexi-9]
MARPWTEKMPAMERNESASSRTRAFLTRSATVLAASATTRQTIEAALTIQKWPAGCCQVSAWLQPGLPSSTTKMAAEPLSISAHGSVWGSVRRIT